MASDVKFTGLDEVRQLVDEHRDALGYAVLLHVLYTTDRKPVVRINLTKLELEPFLDASHAGEPSRVQLCAALMRRVLVEVERHWSGTGTHSYMLRLYRPGGRSVKGPSFHVERSPPPVPTALAPIVVALNGENLPEARVWRALGAAVEDFVGTVVRSVTGLMDAEHRVNEHLADQRAKSWRLIEALSDPGRSGGLRAMLQDPLACEALARHLLEVARDIGELGP